MKKLLVIAPCYNEEEVLHIFREKMLELLEGLKNEEKIDVSSDICLVDDGSSDKTWEIISSYSNENKNIKGVKLSRNFGHQYALLAGMETFKDQYDGYLTIDVDLQDDIRVIPEMVDALEDGYNIAYGVRKKRDSDGFFKKYSAVLFYRLMNRLGAQTVFNHADFRLIDHAILENFLQYKEYHLFLRGIFPSIGFSSKMIFYDRLERKAGESKYPLRKMLSFAWRGITSFSIKPLRFILMAGMFTFVLSFLMGCWVVYTKIMNQDVQGWTSLMIVILFFSSLQMLSIGLIGEYLGKIYQEIKGRPRYIVEKVLD